MNTAAAAARGVQELATVVEELYIAALLHAEDQWDLETWRWLSWEKAGKKLGTWEVWQLS